MRADIIFFILIIIFGLFMTIRMLLVYRLRMRLLREESKWLHKWMFLLIGKGVLSFQMTKDQFCNSIYRRMYSLPPYFVMCLGFYKSLSEYEKELKPIEDYYFNGKGG